MSGGLLQLAAFDVDLDGGRSNATRWKTWIRRFNNYLVANGIAGDQKQIATLLHVAGEKIEEIYEAKRKTNVEKKDEKFG